LKNFFSNGFNILVVDAYSRMELCTPTWLNHDYGDGGVVDILAVDAYSGVTVELSTRLLTTQHEIETLRILLRNVDATIRGYMRMVEDQASDLYASDTDTWTATSSVQSLSKEPAVSSHSPSGSRSH
jgi:hypothetical protein